MLQRPKKNFLKIKTADPRWKDLYQIGGISSSLIAGFVICAIAAYFIWPYKNGFTSMENIFSALQVDRLGGLISLDLSMLVIAPINILAFLAMYAALKQVNESYALIAMVAALMAVVLVIQARPLTELIALSDKYAAATSVADRSLYLAAGEALHTYFDGTAWLIQTIFFMVSGLINSLLMLRTYFFSKTTAWTGIIMSFIGMGFFLPVIGIVLLFLNTIGGVLWCILLARDFFRMKQQLQILPA